MKSSLARLGAQLLDMSAKSNYPIAQKPGIGAVAAFFASDQSNRKYPERKAYLTDKYTRILTQSNCILAFQHNNLSAAEIKAIRVGLMKTKVPEGSKPMKLSVIRAGVMSAACNKQESIASFDALLSGPMLFLHSDGPLLPSYITQVLTQVDKATGFRPPAGSAFPPRPFESTEALLTHTGPSVFSMVNPRVFCVGGIVDGKVMGPEAIRTVGTLPGLKELQAQVVGLVGSPASQISGVLGMASGGQLNRVLEGLKVKLEEEQGGKKEEGA
ncbi:Ribosomal protein L10/acidic P0 [Phaffia rhodozyma]|uniref:Ribosomal protein L10/acidic P0 n=1 Tax=Phaffia rhodozyma TaxID=264483 RepID=A0A0F7SZ16_PHARH|nr:Ribosomal protein L10/acidic P0 [Phaffia rhodozyma]